MTSQIDWPSIRAAAVTLGVREAARRAAVNLDQQETTRFVNRALKRSEREGWIKQKNAIISNHPAQAKPLSAVVINGAESIANSLADDSRETRINLSRGLKNASKHVADMDGAQAFKNARTVKEVAQGASLVHSWEAKANASPIGNLSLNILTNAAAIQLNASGQEE